MNIILKIMYLILTEIVFITSTSCCKLSISNISLNKNSTSYQDGQAFLLAAEDLPRAAVLDFTAKYTFINSTAIKRTTPNINNYPGTTTTEPQSTSTHTSTTVSSTPILTEVPESSTTTAAIFTTETTPNKTESYCEAVPPKDEAISCPAGLKAIFPRMCYVVLEEELYPPTCPYKNSLPYYDIKFIIKFLNLHNTEIWINAVRNHSSGYGHYEWVERGRYYGQAVINNVSKTKRSTNKNCLVVKNEIFIPTDCSKKHKSLCVYHYGISNYCSNHYVNGKCVESDFDFEHGKCYCKKSIKMPYPKKSYFCSKFAEPKYQFQTHRLLFGFKDSEPCWFGLDKSPNNEYLWISSGEPVTYSYWSSTTNCKYSEPSITFTTDRGWTLHNDGSLGCAFCDFTVKSKPSTLELKHNLNSDKITLNIQNPFSISDINGVYDVHCFSDGNDDDFKEKTKIPRDDLGNNLTNYTLYINNITSYPSHYWCKAFQFPNNDVVMSNIIVANNRAIGYGFEYVLNIVINTSDTLNPLLDKKHVSACRFLTQAIKHNILSIRPISLLLYDEESSRLEIIAHLTTQKRIKSLVSDYENLWSTLQQINNEQSNITITKFLNSEMCLPEISFTSDNDTLEWPETMIGVTAIPTNKLCLNQNNTTLPVTRKCEGDFLNGASWGKIQGDCPKNVTYSKITEELFNLLNGNASAEEITTNLTCITKENKDPIVADVYLISAILNKVVDSDEKTNSTNLVTSISNVMEYDRLILHTSQTELNSTDYIIASLDHFLEKENKGGINTDFILVKTFRLETANAVSVVLLGETESYNNFESCSIKLLEGVSIEDIVQNSNIEAAIFFSSEVLQEIREHIYPANVINLVVTMFYNDVLFNEYGSTFLTKTQKGKVISAFIPGFNNFLESEIKMIFRLPQNYSNVKDCSFWQYGQDNMMINTYGRWKSDGKSKNETYNAEICEFSHMTHFGLLLQGKIIENLKVHETFLEILTCMGLVLSLIGVMPIFLTAIVFEVWRSRPGNKILVLFCITITFQSVLLFISDIINDDQVACTIVGASLHYTVLSEFCWMFVVALLQHRRFVSVIKPPPRNIVKKSTFVGWGVPLIPITIAVIVSPSNYGINSNHFCYVQGTYITYGLLLPVALIFCINLIIFIKIIFNILKAKTMRVGQDNHTFKLKVFLIIFLFFMLGITWIFGLIGAFGGGVFFTYVFCLTATLRGFVLFVYFTFGNKETLLLWKRCSLPYIESPRKCSPNHRLSEWTNT